MNVFDELLKILPPPESPIDNVIDWGMVESRNGFEYPLDYKRFIELYGSGSICDFFWVINPKAKNKAINVEKADYFLWAYEDLKEQFPDDFQRSRFPASGSFYPWGFTDNGDCLAWDVSGRCNDWGVVVIGSDLELENAYSFSFSEFLVELLSRRIMPSAIAGNFTMPPVFKVTHS